MIKVKVCGMLDRMNIRVIAGTGPDFLGFIFYPGSKRYVGKHPDKDLFHEVPGEIKKVGVFVNEEPENIIKLAALYGLGLVQLHGNESPACCEKVASAGLGVIKAFGVGPEFEFENTRAFRPFCEYFLFDAQSDQHGGTGLQFNWDVLKRYNFDIPFFLSGGISVSDAGAIRLLRHPSLFAADINSRFEISPGIKDAGLVRSFITAINKNNP